MKQLVGVSSLIVVVYRGTNTEGMGMKFCKGYPYHETGYGVQ